MNGVRVLGADHYSITRHVWDDPANRGTHCRECDALTLLAIDARQHVGWADTDYTCGCDDHACPERHPARASGTAAQSATHFTFPDGTVGPGNWNPETGQVEPVPPPAIPGLREAAAALVKRLTSMHDQRIDLEFAWEGEWTTLRAALASETPGGERAEEPWGDV